MRTAGNVTAWRNGARSSARLQALSGFALLETLVALLVMTTGMLGLVSLQSQNIAGRAQDARQLRALRLVGDLVASLQLVAPAERNAGPVMRACDSSTVCAPPLFAGHVRARWQARVGRELPQGTGRYALNADATAVSIELSWTDPRGRQQLRMDGGL